MKLQYRIRDLLAVTFVAVILLALWRHAVIDHEVPPSILPGPIWFVKFFVPVRFLGPNPFIHVVVGSVITVLLAAGVCSVLFRLSAWTIALSAVCLLLWFWCGLVMSNVMGRVLIV